MEEQNLHSFILFFTLIWILYVKYDYKNIYFDCILELANDRCKASDRDIMKTYADNFLAIMEIFTQFVLTNWI